jgi:hypothetical protein
MSNRVDEIVKGLREKLNELRKKIKLKEDEFSEKGLFKRAKVASSISTDVLDALSKIDEHKVKIIKFIELSEKFRDSPEELIYLLSLPDIPITAGSGKQIAEAIAGFRGLGIETIDHKIDEIKYENVSLREGEHPLSEVSMTTFMYRAPPFELTKCMYESEDDREITDILGSRFAWLLKPKEVSWDSWDEILKKTMDGKITPLIKGKYTCEGTLIVPKTIELIDLSARSIILEVGGIYPFFLKLGSSVIERETASMKTKQKLLQYLKEKSGTIEKSIGSALASWKLRLDYPYFCYKGLGLSTDPFDVNCPFKGRCRLSSDRGGPCDGKIFWSGKYGRRRFYPKSYPLRRLRVGKGGLTVYNEKFPLHFINFTAYEKKKVESRWYAVEIGTWFINARPTVRIFFDREIGYAIPTSVMEISFDREWLNNIIKEILDKEKDVRKNIALKFILNKALGKTLDYKRLSKTVQELIDEKSKLAKEYAKYIEDLQIDAELMNFARRALLHSLEHNLTQYILEKFAGVDMSFVLTKYYYKYNSDRIILAENAKNGRIGIVDTITREIRENGLHTFMYYFTDWLSNYLTLHGNDIDRLTSLRMREAERTLNQAINRLERGDSKDQGIAKKIKGVCKKVEDFKKKLEASNIELDITLARTVLLTGGIVSETEVEEIGDYFDDILERYGFKLCLDGCNGCVRLEKYCGEGTQQILTTSRTLLHKFVEHLKDMMTRGLTIRSNELGKYIEPILFGAKKSLDVLCPYISPSYANELVELASNGVKVRVITWMPKAEDEEHKFQMEALKILKENLSLGNLSVKVEDKPEVKLIHDKTYIVDNIVLTGSFNLTESAFYGNFERAEIKLHPQTVITEKNQYEELWRKAKDLSSYEIS